MRKSIYQYLLRGMYFLLLSYIFFACGSVPTTDIQVAVINEDTQEAIDSVEVRIMRFYEGGEREYVASLFTDAEGRVNHSFEHEKGYTYEIVAEKSFYEPIIKKNSGSYSHIAQLENGKPNELNLTLIPIMAAAPQVISGDVAKSTADEMILQLRSGNWGTSSLPRLEWGDIEKLLEIGNDSLVIYDFPIKPGSKLKPDSARMGQIALWTIEAIRRDLLRGENRPVFLMPPSNVPVLGTRRGNPRLFNSKDALGRAHAAYEKWWNEAQTMDTVKAARRNPLRGTGLGWM